MGILESGSRRSAPAASQRELVAAADDAAARNRASLAEVFARAHVWVETTEDERGDLVLHTDAGGTRWVHAYSDPEMLPGAAYGQEVWSVTLTGAQLRARLTPDIGIRLDPGHRYSVDVVLPTLAPVATPIVAQAEPDAAQAGGDGAAEDGRSA